MKSVYTSVGKTPKEAFEGIWDLLQFKEDACLRQEGDKWRIRLVVEVPTDTERRNFEKR